MKPHKTAAQHKIFAKEMAAGNSIKQSMITAGYSEKQASKGVKAISQKMLKALSKEGVKLADFGKQFSLDELKNVAIGRLVQNAITGKDGGVMSAKTLGSHRDLNLWTPEQMAGVIVLQAPTFAAENKAKLLADEPDAAISAD
jgi:nucleoid DNA-binding protein